MKHHKTAIPTGCKILGEKSEKKLKKIETRLVFTNEAPIHNY